MKKQLKKILEKALIFLLRAITILACIIVLIFSCGAELEKAGAIIYGCSIAWLGLVGLAAWLYHKGIIR